MGFYVGLKEKTKPAVFESATTPTKETRPQFDFIYGPFNTQQDAQRYVNAMDDVVCGEG